MTSWEKYVDVIILFTDDMARSKMFYRDVLGLEPDRHDNDFRFGEVLVILLDRSAAADQIAPATAAGADAGSRLMMTIVVDDIDAVCADLARRGVELAGAFENRLNGHRAARFSDPSGHIWEIAQSSTTTSIPKASPETGTWDNADKKISHLTLFVANLDRARSFYQDIFGLAPEAADRHSAALQFQNMSVTLLDIHAAEQLVGPRFVVGRTAGSRFQLTNFMDPDLCDVDTAAAQLGAHGVALLSGPADRPWGKRTIVFADADRCIWELVQNAANQTDG